MSYMESVVKVMSDGEPRDLYDICVALNIDPSNRQKSAMVRTAISALKNSHGILIVTGNSKRKIHSRQIKQSVYVLASQSVLFEAIRKAEKNKSRSVVDCFRTYFTGPKITGARTIMFARRAGKIGGNQYFSYHDPSGLRPATSVVPEPTIYA